MSPKRQSHHASFASRESDASMHCTINIHGQYRAQVEAQAAAIAAIGGDVHPALNPAILQISLGEGSEGIPYSNPAFKDFMRKLTGIIPPEAIDTMILSGSEVARNDPKLVEWFQKRVADVGKKFPGSVMSRGQDSKLGETYYAYHQLTNGVKIGYILSRENPSLYNDSPHLRDFLKREPSPDYHLQRDVMWDSGNGERTLNALDVNQLARLVDQIGAQMAPFAQTGQKGR